MKLQFIAKKLKKKEKINSLIKRDDKLLAKQKYQINIRMMK